MVTTTLTPNLRSNQEKLITLTGIKWLTFKAIMSDVGDGRAWRIAYGKGFLEIREEREDSLAFPFLPIAEISGLIEQSKAIGQRAAVRLFRESVREVLAE